MSRRYKNSHLDFGIVENTPSKIASQDYTSNQYSPNSQYGSNPQQNYESNLQSFYDSRIPSENNLSEPRVSMVMSPHDVHLRAQPQEVSSRFISSSPRQHVSPRASQKVFRTYGGGRQRETTTVSRRRAVEGRDRRGYHDPVDKHYKCLKQSMLIDVILWGSTILLAIVPFFFNSIWAVGFTFLIPLIPAIIMELICLIMGINDRNYNYIKCTLIVRQIISFVLIVLGLIMFIAGLIMVISGTKVESASLENFAWGLLLFVCGCFWLAIGILSYFVTIFYSMKEWNKIKSH